MASREFIVTWINSLSQLSPKYHGTPGQCYNIDMKEQRPSAKLTLRKFYVMVGISLRISSFASMEKL